MPAKTATPRWRMVVNSVVLAGIGGAVLWFAVEGGEYGTREMLAQHQRRAGLERDVQQLQREVDSLQREKKAVLRDDAVLERIAREQYGMLRGSKEILFWVNDEVVPRDSASHDTPSGR